MAGKHKAIFLDRDNTLIEDPGYINHPGQVKLLPGSAASLSQLKKMGYLLVIASNQSAVARGIVTEEVLEQIHHRLKKLLADDGAYIDAVYYCPFHPDGVIPKYRRESDLRKPAAGMLLKAADELNIDLSASWTIGDSYRDIAAGAKAGTRTILIDNPVRPALKKPADTVPDQKAVNLREAVNIIKMIEYQDAVPQGRPCEQTAPAPQIPFFVPEPVIEECPDVEPAEAMAVSEPAKEDAPAQNDSAPAAAADTTQRQTETDADKNQEILQQVLKHLKIRNSKPDEEFSISKLLAGVAQSFVFFCLLLSLWFLMDPARDRESVRTPLEFAAVLQLVAIGLYMMRDRK